MDKGFLIVRIFILIGLILFLLNPKSVQTYRRNPEVAFVLDLSESSEEFEELYEELYETFGKKYDFYELGDSITKLKDIKFYYNRTNLSSLSKLTRKYDYIVYVGDGWHNAGDLELDMRKPISVLINRNKNPITLEKVLFPERLLRGEEFQLIVKVLSSKDTFLDVRIDTISTRVRLRKGENILGFNLKAKEEVELQFGKFRRKLRLNIVEESIRITMNLHKVSPEVALLKNALENRGMSVELRFKEFSDEGLSIGFFGDIGEDVIVMDEERIGMEVKNGRMFVRLGNAWLLRNEEKVLNVLDSIASFLESMYPKVDVKYRLEGNIAYFEVLSNVENIDVLLNGENKSKSFALKILGDTTLELKVLFKGREIYRRSFHIEPDEFETEEGINYALLEYMASRSGGKLVNSPDKLEFESIEEKRMVSLSNEQAIWLALILTFLIEVAFRRMRGLP